MTPKVSSEINIPTTILLSIIGFFLVKTFNQVESINEKQYEFEKRITRIETKLFGSNPFEENVIVFPKAIAMLPITSKQKELKAQDPHQD